MNYEFHDKVSIVMEHLIKGGMVRLKAEYINKENDKIEKTSCFCVLRKNHICVLSDTDEIVILDVSLKEFLDLIENMDNKDVNDIIKQQINGIGVMM